MPILAGTDAMNPFCFPGSSLHDELALFVESGLTPLAALQSGTLRPAEFLGRTEELGVIAPGRRADLVLLSADPLADIHNTTKIQAVWLHGKYFDCAASTPYSKPPSTAPAKANCTSLFADHFEWLSALPPMK